MLAMLYGRDWTDILWDNGHEPPDDEVLEFLAMLLVSQARLPLRRGSSEAAAAVAGHPEHLT